LAIARSVGQPALGAQPENDCVRGDYSDTLLAVFVRLFNGAAVWETLDFVQPEGGYLDPENPEQCRELVEHYLDSLLV
jgi:hypothetical protein